MMGVWWSELGMNTGARGFKGRGAGKLGGRGAEDPVRDRTEVGLDEVDIFRNYLLSIR